MEPIDAKFLAKFSIAESTHINITLNKLNS